MHLPNYSVLSPDSDEESIQILGLQSRLNRFIAIKEDIRICTI